MIILKTITFTSTTFKTMTPGVADFRDKLFQQWGLFENFKVHILLVPPMYLVEFCPPSNDSFFKKVEPCLPCKCRILLEQGHWHQVFSLFINIIINININININIITGTLAPGFFYYYHLHKIWRQGREVNQKDWSWGGDRFELQRTGHAYQGGEVINCFF